METLLVSLRISNNSCITELGRDSESQDNQKMYVVNYSHKQPDMGSIFLPFMCGIENLIVVWLLEFFWRTMGIRYLLDMNII